MLLAPDVSAFRAIGSIAAVIPSAALLSAAASARRAPLPDPLAPLRRAAGAALIGASAFAVAALVAGISAPGGVLALLIGAAAGVLLARAFRARRPRYMTRAPTVTVM